MFLLEGQLVTPRLFRSLGLDVWNIRTVREEGRANAERAAQLEGQLNHLRREHEASIHRARRVIEGTITFAEAVVDLDQVMRHRPEFALAWSCASDPPPTPRHAAARCVIAHVETELQDDPKRRAAVVSRLKAEYASMR